MLSLNRIVKSVILIIQLGFIHSPSYLTVFFSRFMILKIGIVGLWTLVESLNIFWLKLIIGTNWPFKTIFLFLRIHFLGWIINSLYILHIPLDAVIGNSLSFDSQKSVTIISRNTLCMLAFINIKYAVILHNRISSFN